MAILSELINFKPEKEEFINIPIGQIKANELNAIYEIEDISSLAANINSAGLLSPLTVMSNPAGGYKLISGHRRLAAVKTLHWDTVPCFVITKQQELDTEDEQLLLVNSNITRDMTPEQKIKIVGTVEQIYDAKKEKGLLSNIKKREYISMATGYGERSIQDYLNKIHGKNEPTKLDIQKFAKYVKLHTLSVSETEERLMQMGRQHTSYYGGMVDFACDPRGIKINNKDKITWKRCLKLIRQYVPLPEEKSIDQQIPGQLSMEEIYPESAGREVREAKLDPIEADTTLECEEHIEKPFQLDYELTYIILKHCPRASNTQINRITVEIKQLLHEMGVHYEQSL